MLQVRDGEEQGGETEAPRRLQLLADIIKKEFYAPAPLCFIYESQAHPQKVNMGPTMRVAF